MRRIVLSFIALVAVVFCGVLVAQSAFTTGTIVKWNPVTKNINGADTIIKGYELSIVPTTVNLNTTGTVPSATITYGSDGWTGLGIANLITNFPEGPARIQARAISAANIPSAWSVPLDGRVVKLTAPNVPDGLKAFISD